MAHIYTLDARDGVTNEERTVSRHWEIVRADSFLDMARVLDTPRHKRAADDSVSYASGRRDWDNGVTWTKLQEALKAGGRRKATTTKLLDTKMPEMDLSFLPQEQRPHLAPDVAGVMPIVPHYVANLPETMLSYRNTDTDRKVIRIAVNVFALCNVPAQEILYRGAALLTVLRALESRGYSTHIDVIASTIDSPSERYAENGFACIIPVKPASRSLSISALAFAMCEPAFSRRGIFGLMERAGPSSARLTQEAYGYLCESGELELLQGYDVRFTGLRRGECRTPEDAIQHVRDHFEGASFDSSDTVAA